ncbi:MAG TPA: hypothetical protein VF552_11865 [Allosphingosinicella sp.]|jgi:hypothetical protein
MAEVKISVEAKGTAYWVAVDDTDVTLVNGRATVQIAPGVHYITWWMLGKPGDSIKLSATSGNTSLGKIETKITSGQDKGAGVMKIEVK